MSQQERWDIVLKLLNGPLVSVGEQKIRGPVVRLGANPGPGGLKLSGYRGLDARQCVITAYSGGSAAVAPVGTNQVRLAPHANVKWRDIDPITGPEYLSEGGALHLGPVGRGATVEFVRCERFGQWEAGTLASEAADVPAEGRQTAQRGGVPASFDARSVRRVSTSVAPFWFLGCSFLMASVTTAAIVLIGAFKFIGVDRTALGPVEEGVEFYRSVDIAQFSKEDAKLLDGLAQGYYAFVVQPNISQAGASAKQAWSEPEGFDQNFLKYTTRSVDQHARSWSFWRRLEAVHVEYAKVVLDLRKAQLPEVMAAIPYQESRYKSSFPSQVCADGYWQFMPETAHRVDVKTDLSFRVADCRLVGANAKWTPTDIAPPPRVRETGEYMDQGLCRITSCDVDDRKDLRKSTAAAIYTLREAWDDPIIAASGSAVQLTITSHNAGYDDSRFGPKYRKRFNIKPAFERWTKKNGSDQGVFFVGQNIRCGSWDERSPCGAEYMAETQHYAYSIVAQHLLAVCYYAKNYGEDPAFNPWRTYTASDGYCDLFKIPSREEVRSHKSGAKR